MVDNKGYEFVALSTKVDEQDEHKPDEEAPFLVVEGKPAGLRRRHLVFGVVLAAALTFAGAAYYAAKGTNNAAAADVESSVKLAAVSPCDVQLATVSPCDIPSPMPTTMMTTTTTTTIGATSISGNFNVYIPGVNESVVVAASTEALANHFNVSANSVNATATEGGRRLRSDARRLAGNWAIGFQFYAPASKAAAVTAKADSASSDQAAFKTTFTTVFKTALANAGAPTSAIDAVQVQQYYQGDLTKPRPWTAMNPDPSKLVWDKTPVPGKKVRGTLTSRLDPFDEDSPFIKVKVLMRFAGVQPAALGPLLGHCGGPGVGKWCGVNLYSQLGPSPDLQDYWGIDQRGIQQSKPRLGCEGKVFKKPAANKSKYVVSDFTDCPCRVPDDVPQIVQTTVDGAQTYFEKIAPRFHGACYTMSKYQLVGANNKTYNFLNYVGTRALAHDIDTFRQAIGAPKMNIYGISYGAYVGGVYASMYPEYANRVVINGNMDPMPDGVADAAGVVHAYSTSVAKLLRNCDQSPKCDYFRKGNDTAWQGYTKVLNRMMAGYYKGKTDKGNDLVVPAVAMVSFILNSMYDASGAGWQEAIQTLAAFYDDSNPTGQQHATDQFLADFCHADGVETWKKYEVCVSRSDLGGGGSFDLEAVFGVDLAGRYTPWQAARRWRSVRSEFGDFAGWLFMQTLGPYANYPATPAPPAPLGNPDVPVLVVGTLYDPINAYRSAQKMHGSFPSGSLMTWQGVGHGMVCDAKYDPGMGDCQCSELIRNFLATGVMPQNGYVCRSNARLPTRLLSK